MINMDPEYPIFNIVLMSNEPLIKNINRPITYHEILEYENIISNIDDIPNKFIIDNKVYNNIFELLKIEISKLNDKLMQQAKNISTEMETMHVDDDSVRYYIKKKTSYS